MDRRGTRYKEYLLPNSKDRIPRSTQTSKKRRLENQVTKKVYYSPVGIRDAQDVRNNVSMDKTLESDDTESIMMCGTEMSEQRLNEIQSVVQVQAAEWNFDHTAEGSYTVTSMNCMEHEDNNGPIESDESEDYNETDNEAIDNLDEASDRRLPNTSINADDDNNRDQAFTILQKMMDDENFLTPIDAAVRISRGELLMNIVKYAVVHSLSLTAVAQLVQLINCIFSKAVLVAETRYLIDKLFNPANCVQFHATCTQCRTYVGQFTRNDRILTCSRCEIDINVHDSAYTDFFITMDTSSAISELIKANSEYYRSVINGTRTDSKNIIRDIYDGKEYRKFVKSLDSADRYRYATTTFNTDGAPVFQSSSYSIWPIQFMINELPFHVRNTELLVAGLWFGKNKPDMNVFLAPFVKNMNRLSEEGVKCIINGDECIIKIFTLVACVDSVARAPMQGLTQYNGRYGCNWCLHPGEWVTNKKKPNSGTLKYPLLDTPPKCRNVYDTIRHMEQVSYTGEKVFGVKNPSELINLNKFDIIRGFVPDNMHCCSGVAKLFAKMWFGNSTETSSILKKNEIDEVNTIVSAIKAPNQVARLTRPVTDKEYWKSREWENWILYFSLPTLKPFLHTKLIQHWALFVEALYILLQEAIPISEIDRADYLLHQFVADTEKIYSKMAMTFNVHILLHLARSVLDWGPLWAHSAYGFESGNGKLLKIIFAARGVHQQICRNMSLQYSLFKLKEYVFPVSSAVVQKFYMGLDSKNVKKTLKTTNARYFFPAKINHSEWPEQLLQVPLATAIGYIKMVKNGCLYSSSTKINPSSDNSFAQLSDRSYIRVLKFAVIRETLDEYTIAQKIRVSKVFRGISVLRKIVETKTNLIAVPTANIFRVCFHTTVHDNEYIVPLTNLHFY